MKEQALEIVRTAETEPLKLNLLREYLQHVVLREMFELDWLNELVFHGGTALRMIHGLDRFSEDLDFHLQKPDTAYSPGEASAGLIKKMKKQGYSIERKASGRGAVKSVMLKFSEILYEAAISPHENEKLNIKIDIDTNPPLGFKTDTHPVTRYINFVVTTHDRPSFLAGKCHAVLQRTYAKGRDYFDLFYYLHQWKDAAPNFSYLNNALQQTGYSGPEITPENWKTELLKRVKKTDWSQVKQDLEPFLSHPADMQVFRRKFLIKLLKTNTV